MTKLDPKLLREKAGDAAKLLKLLANDKRLLVVCRLLEGERSVGDLAADVGLSASAVSQHLARLRSDGILATRRDSQTIFYRLASQEAREVMTALASVFCPPPKKKRKKQ